MTYRVSTSRSGDQRRWEAHETIPETHIGIRAATVEESAVMDEIINSPGDPPLALGERISATLNG